MVKGIIIQARMGSSRLPGKMGKVFYDGKSLLDVILDRLQLFSDRVQVIVATSQNEADDFIVNTARRKGIKVYRGSEENVLNRFVEAADHFGIDTIIRICADNPFIQLDFIENLIKSNYESVADYVGYRVNGEVPAIKTHVGFFPELVTKQSLKKLDTSDPEPFYKEHVTNYFYSKENSEFSVEWIDIEYPKEVIKNIRLTIDTEQDFELVNGVYEYLNENEIPFTDEEILEYLYRKPMLTEKMKESIEQNEK